MNRSPAPSLLPNDHEQRIAAIREKAQRHAQRSARLFAPPPEPEDSDLPVPSLLAVACSVALANQAQAATSVSNDTDLRLALGSATDIELTQDISLSSESRFVHNGLNIDGKDHTVDLNKNRALFNRAYTLNINNISNITFKNGASKHNWDFNGGVVDLHGTGGITGNIIESHFENNYANNGGGAISSNYISGSIQDSSFTGNTAKGGVGGAIHIAMAGSIYGNIEGSRFEDNTAQNSGGAVYAQNIKGTIRDSHFINNTSTTSHGGALHIVNDLEGGIEDSYFERNNAKLNGGVIDIATLTGGIRNSQFIDNHSQAGVGGAVFVHSESGVLGGISGSTFEGNSALDGGAVLVKGTIETGIQDSIFKDNKSLGTSVYSGGGAIHASVINGGISDGSVFEGNTGASAGAIFLSNGSVGTLNGGIDNSKFIGNTAIHNGGGAIHLHNGTLNGGIKNHSEFKDNIAKKRNGGALWLLYFNDGISKSTFTGNKALEGIGGAINSEITFKGGITDSVFKENEAYISGGALYTNTFSGGVNNSTFEKNTATTSGGGAIHVANTLSGGIQNNSQFTENTAKSHGGAIWLTNFEGGIDNATFKSNTSQEGAGGAIWARYAIKGGITDSTFEKNTASGTGIDNGTGAAGGGSGGAIRVKGIEGGINNSQFIGNTSTYSGGGAIHVWDDAIKGGIHSGTEFKNNTAQTTGGAIWVNAIEDGISDAHFTGNKALTESGGAINAHVSISGGITDSTFKNNSAGTLGGAIHANSITGAITATFSDNTAGVHGGALYLTTGSNNSTIHSSVFSANEAGDLGGAIFHQNWGYLNIENSLFLGNVAQASGGAIKTQGQTSIKDSAFIGNQAKNQPSATALAPGVGGALLVQGKLAIENSVFLGNTSFNRGAAIHHHHDGSSGAQNIQIISKDAGRTLFYGNKETDTGRYSSIEFAHHRASPSLVTIDANKGAGYVEGHSGVLMLDAMQSVNRAGGAGKLTINKTGDGDWFLGGDNQMKHPGDWVINQGRLALTDVDYDGSGASQAQINLTNGYFSLANGAVLEGRGTISADEINLKGTINPNIWRNTGMLAKDITTSITQAEIDTIQTVADKADSFATLTLDTQGSGNAVKMDGATYEVGVAWKDNGAGGFDAQSDLLDVKGGLDVKNSSINITRLDFDHDWALARVAGGGTEPAAQVIQTTDGITGDFKVEVAGTLAPSSDFLKVRGEQSGNNYEVKVGLSWYSKERDGSRTAVSGNSVLDAHGGFTIAAGNDFTLDGALGKRTDAVNFQDETSESGGSKGWDGNSLTKRGDGTLILNGENTYDGLTTVEAGKLVLGNSAAKASARVGGDVQINTGAIFDGYGTAKGNITVDNGGQFTGFGGAEGLVHVKNGGLLAPGSATEMGTINAGSLQMDAGSTYRVKTNTTGAVDHIQVANDVTLNGGTVDVRARDGNWGKRGTQHMPRSIIQAGGTLTGTFDNVTTDLAFLTPKLDYNNGHVMLGLTRNSTKMEDIADGTTHNRMSAAEGLAYLEASGANPTLMNELLGLNKDDALRAFDSLSGEIYPTTNTVLMQSSRQLRTRVNTRLTAHTQGTDEAPSFNTIRALGTGDTGTSTPVWVSAWGHNGNQGRTPNAAHADISGHGVVVGMDNTDRPLAGGLHAGVMFGSESTKVQIADGRDSRSEVDSRSAGIYGGSAIGNTQWRGGLIYSHLDVETQRTVTVNSLTEHLQSERKGKQMQAFAEVSHNLTLSPRTSVAPWLNVAKVWQRLDAAQEGNGATALELEKQSASATTVSMGGRGQVSLGDGRTPVSVYADVGYQYVIDGKNTDSKHHFAGQPQDFAVRGTSLNDSLVGAVGVQLGLSRNSALLVEYRGELGSGQQQHVGNVSWQVKF